MPTLTIKKGNLNLVQTDRAYLLEVQPSYDGIVFNFKEGFSLNYTDNYMPAGSKDLIVNSTNSFPNASLIIDLGNYSKPISATIL